MALQSKSTFFCGHPVHIIHYKCLMAHAEQIFATLNVSHCQSTSKNVLPYKVRDSMDGNLGIIFWARLDLISKQSASIMWDYGLPSTF